MSVTTAPVTKSWPSAEEAVFHKPGPHTIPLTESPDTPFKTSAVYFYRIPGQVAKLRQAGVQKDVLTELGPVPYTLLSTKILPYAPSPVAVHMAGFLPKSTLTYTYRTKAVAYLNEKRAEEGRSTSIVASMDTGQERVYRGQNFRPRRGSSSDLRL